jgi:hypothetical protein
MRHGFRLRSGVFRRRMSAVLGSVMMWMSLTSKHFTRGDCVASDPAQKAMRETVGHKANRCDLIAVLCSAVLANNIRKRVGRFAVRAAVAGLPVGALWAVHHSPFSFRKRASGPQGPEVMRASRRFARSTFMLPLTSKAAHVLSGARCVHTKHARMPSRSGGGLIGVCMISEASRCRCRASRSACRSRWCH